MPRFILTSVLCVGWAKPRIRAGNGTKPSEYVNERALFLLLPTLLQHPANQLFFPLQPLQDRPGRQGDWTYPNTDALGLMEYMQWCLDMNMEPLLGVWAGLSLNATPVTGTALEPYTADVLAELEFLLGDAQTTTQGALRAQYGRAEPYQLRYVEIGNEDNLSGGCASYAARFTDVYDAVHAQYPNLTLVTSTASQGCLPATLPEGVWTDIHHYLSPDEFVDAFTEWDNAPRDGPGILVGEYGSTVGNDGSKTYWSNMQGSCSEVRLS